jgi:hypothetical protein
MSILKIVHITPTPLVGSPGNIARAQRMAGHEALAVALSDYPKGGPLEKIFLERTLIIDEFSSQYIEESIKHADIIHIHNYLPNDRVGWLSELNQSAAYVYQSHSPLREGPLYVGRGDEDAPFDFKAKLVVGQHWGRFYPSFQPVPNIILPPPSIRLRRAGEKLRVMFSPTHKHVGRWTSKYSQQLENVLTALAQMDKVELISPKKPVPPETLMEVRRSCHVSIDEIATGGFHMVSLEAMCAGNIAINRADYFSKATFASFCDGKMPPFAYADDGCIAEILIGLADDWEETARQQQESYDYFRLFCDPLRLIEVFDAVYENVQ